MQANIQMSPSRRKLVLLAMMAQNFAFAITSFAPGIAVPQIVAGFNRSEYFALVGVLYSLSQTIVAPVAACLGDRIGRKWINAGSLILMCVASLFTYFSQSFVMFLISWTICGFCVGGFVTGPYLIVMDVYEQSQWGKATASLVSAMSAGMILGPVIAGLIVDAGWLRGVYLLPLPFYIIAIVLQLMAYPNKKGSGKLKLDGPGVLWLTIAVTAFVVILNFGGSVFAWKSMTTLILAVVMVVATILLIVRDTKIEQPAVELRSLKNRYVLISSLLNFLYSAYAVLSAGFLVYFAQGVLQVSATSSSTLLLPQVIVTLFLPQIIGRWCGQNARRYKIALTAMGISGAITLIGISMMNAGNSIVILYALMAFGGIGYTVFCNCIAPFMTMNIPPETAGAANGCRQFFNLLGVTLSSSLFAMILGMHADFTVAISRVFLIGGLLCLLTTPIALFFIKIPQKSESHNP